MGRLRGKELAFTETRSSSGLGGGILHLAVRVVGLLITMTVIALLSLHPDVRAKFNSVSASKYARSMSGKPYGYHNMIFSWTPLDAHLVISVMSMWTRVQPAYAAKMWNEAQNKWLGTEDLDLYGILEETEGRGVAFDQLLTIPEQDEWVYCDGKSTKRVAFILRCIKRLGSLVLFLT